MKKTVYLFSLFVLFSLGLRAQVITTTLPTTYAYPATTVVVPVLVDNFNGIASVSLIFSYNNTILTYQSFQNVNPALSSNLMINTMPSGTMDQVVISWFSISPVSLGTDTLMEFVFTYNGGTTSLSWDTLNVENCQYANLNGDILPALFEDGMISPVQPNSTVLPVMTAIPGTDILVPVTVASFNNVANIQQKLDYDPAVLSYIGYQFANPLLAGGTLLINDNSGSITTSWSSPSAVSLGDDTLYVLHFNYLGGSTALSWDTLSPGACQYTGSGANVLPSSFYNGGISSSVIQLQAAAISICNGVPIVVPVSVSNCNGIQSFSLTITYDDSLVDYNGYQSLNTSLGNDFSITHAEHSLTLTWNDTASINLGSAVICELKFTAHNASGGYTDLAWNSALSQFFNAGGQSIPVNFIGGSIAMNPNLNLGPNVEVCKYHSATLYAGSAFVTYLWSTGDTTATILVDSTLGSGIYTVTVTNFAGCTGVDSIQVSFVPCVGIEDISQLTPSLTVFPNPSHGGSINIMINEPGKQNHLHLTDLSGRIIFSKDFSSGEDSQKIQLDDVASGVYLLRYISENTSITKKIVIH